MTDDYTPAQFWKGLGTWFGVGLFIAVVIAGIVVGGWQAGWWFSNQNATRNYQQVQNGVSNQDTLRSQITSNFQLLATENRQAIADKGNPGLVGQDKVEAAATAATLCQEGEQVNTAVPLPGDQTAWFSTNCSLGVVVPTSPNYVP